MKSGILLVSFGAGNAKSAVTLKHLQARVEDRFNLPVRWAYTSEPLRTRLARVHTKSDSVLKALRRMHFERYTHVVVQSLHLIPGLEYSAVLADVERAVCETGLCIQPGRPLLEYADDTVPLAQALLRHIPEDRLSSEAVIFMGHGSRHSSESLYWELDAAVKKSDPLVHVACMKGHRTLESLLPELRGSQAPFRVWLLPLLSVIGKHSLDDMAGPQPDSWKSVLDQAGFACRAELRALADGPDFVELWMSRIGESLRRWY